MSRFFSRGYHYDTASSSEEEELLTSSEEELMSSSEEEVVSDDSFFNDSESESAESDDDSDGKPYGPDWFKKPQFRKAGAAGGSGASRFLKGNADSSDDSDDEGKKVVKSARDKLLDELNSCYNKIDAAEMTQDWTTILSELESATKLLVKAQQQNMGTPNVFVRVVAQVEDLVAETSQAEIKNKIVAKAYNTVKQRVRKIARENEELLAKFRQHPEAFEKNSTVELGQARDFDASELNLMGRNVADRSAVVSSPSDFFSALRIVIDSRGKKGTDIQAQIKTMEELVSIAKSPYESIIAYLNLIPIRFDACANLAYQPLEQWKASHNNVTSLLELLEANLESYHVTELAPRNEFIEEEPQPNENGVRQILGSVFTFVERLDDEFNKSLLNTDPHSSDYLDRLRDEQSVYNLILRSQLYLEKVLPEDTASKHLCRSFVRRLDHIYYKTSKLVDIVERAAWASVPANSSSKYITYSEDPDYNFKLVNTLCTVVSSEQEMLKRRATLYQIYYYALNNQFSKAKDMLVQSSVRNSINSQDPTIQILFNRVVVQLGLAAFKLCLVEDCHQILNEVSTASHLRDIMGQQSLQRVSNNISANGTVTPTEMLCLPFHQHINLDLIDAVFMTCSLLIEIPHMAAFYSGIKVKRIPYSQKSIRRALEHYEKSSFQGPPETLRDHVIHAAKAMQRGNWAQCINYLRSISTWNLLGDKMEKVLEQLAERIQIESLKTYIFTYKRFYTKLSVQKLSELFSLPTEQVVSVIQTLENTINIKGSLNEAKEMLIFDKGDEITKLEEVAIKLTKETKYQSERLNNVSQRQ
ncbi:AaceriAGL344Cp [[Ashbya] aceris (nom. inval.)]|nr:AaceriAGL344Cp [[Ashbya] aceris (nom. inval.)]